MSVSTSIPLEGVLNCWNDEHDLPDLLLSISRSGRTGRLLFSNPEADKTLHVQEGKIVFAESSSEDDGLGQHLLRSGQISLMDYVRVSRRVEKGKRLGALLVEDGVLEPKELVPAVMGQVRAIILGLFRRTETWYRFKDVDLPQKDAITLDMPVSQLVLDGVQYVESWRRVSKGVGSLDSVYRRVAASASEWGRLDLNEGNAELLDMLEEPVSVDHVCTHASLPDFDACRYLWAFRCLGWVERVEAPKTVIAASPQAPGPAQVATVPSVPPVQEPVVSPPAPAAPPAIAQHLIDTRVAVEPPKEPPPAAPAPKPNVEALARTQLAIDAERAALEPPSAAKKPIPEKLVHTQLFEAPEHYDDPEPETPSTGEMMEAILEGEEPRPSPPSKPAPPPDAARTQFFGGPRAVEPPKPKASTTASTATTQFFDGSSALEPPPPKPKEEPPPEADDEVPYGFEALALHEDAAPIPSAAVTAPSIPIPSPEADAEEGSLASFDDLAYAPEPSVSEAETEAPGGGDVPVVEASVVEDEDRLPVLDPEAVEPPQTAASGGMEALASADPFSSGGGFAFEGIDSDDPRIAPRRSEREHRPSSPPQKESDLDMDGLNHLLSSD